MRASPKFGPGVVSKLLISGFHGRQLSIHPFANGLVVEAREAVEQALDLVLDEQALEVLGLEESLGAG